MKRVFSWKLPVFFCLCLSSCAENGEKPNEIAQYVGVEERSQKFFQRNNRFAFDLYNQAKTVEGNLVFSPYNIASAFALIYPGAVGQTAEEIEKVFHFQGEPNQILNRFQQINESLSENRDPNLNHPQIDIANSIWIQHGFSIQQRFLRLVSKYNVFETVDFHSNPEGARELINRWVSAYTNDKIQDLFKPNQIEFNTRMVLASAIYLQAKWKNHFLEDKTEEMPFKINEDEEIDVPFMNTVGPFPFTSNDQFTLLELPYKGGVDSPAISMLILLPHEIGTLAEIENNLNASTYSQLLDSLQEQRIEVFIPKFSFTQTSFDLKEYLMALGMKNPFTREADFSQIAYDLVISAAAHQAFISVDETGTSAGAATGIAVGVKSMPPQENLYTFKADHPFLFMIIDKQTQVILFIGRIIRP